MIDQLKEMDRQLIQSQIAAKEREGRLAESNRQRLDAQAALKEAKEELFASNEELRRLKEVELAHFENMVTQL